MHRKHAHQPDPSSRIRSSRRENAIASFDTEQSHFYTLVRATSDVIVQQIAQDYATYAQKLSAGADSVLAQLSPSEFEAGMKALRAHAARVGDKPVCEPIDVFVFRKEDAGPAHPLFGPLTRREWGVVTYKHTDHHLRQFGA